ncbi:MAG: type III secretion inner membrane ring lipoprotein SctJ [Sandaracinaceae bacterium]|nr:type III secretion inner membrane ring lipoprotein SctJ [Sandaracinaceae bacterium]
MKRYVGLAALAALATVGCQTELERGLDESQANAIVVALDQHGIGASKAAEMGGGDEPSFTVSVAPDDVAPALSVLRSEGLPRERDPGLGEMFGEGSLVPTATEERARMTAALSGELAQSIESIDGVLDARVHIALPQAQALPLDAPRPHARASVMVRYRGQSPPYDEAAIRRLVAGAIEDMSVDDVAVVGVAAAPAAESERQLATIGPFSVSRGSATGLKAAFATLLGSNLLLALGLVLSLVRASRQRREAEEAAAKDAKK